MRAEEVRLTGVLLLEPRRFRDSRGFFVESWNQRAFDSVVGRHVGFVQDNHSMSNAGVLRGLHYQMPPHAQGKLVRCTAGRIWDVAVDIRRSSPTYGSWMGWELTAENGLQVWIPEGFAHGFISLEDDTEVQYKATGYYAPQAERTIRYDDPTLGIEWPLASPTLSEKDQKGVPLDEADTFE